MASGISGNGPSYFAVTREGEEGPIVDFLSRYGEVKVARGVDVEGRD